VVAIRPLGCLGGIVCQHLKIGDAEGLVRALVGVDGDHHVGDPTALEVEPGCLLLGNHDRQNFDPYAL
jgi:hypothetical protein